mmetsp:Transcript_20228/g.38059  ORF Transcript_20228/g.38059 Transcript_20228/m.38059 type:complete len:235 (+) Transcript_20228:360-1064(+)
MCGPYPSEGDMRSKKVCRLIIDFHVNRECTVKEFPCLLLNSSFFFFFSCIPFRFLKEKCWVHNGGSFVAIFFFLFLMFFFVAGDRQCAPISARTPPSRTCSLARDIVAEVHDEGFLLVALPDDPPNLLLRPVRLDRIALTLRGGLSNVVIHVGLLLLPLQDTEHRRDDVLGGETGLVDLALARGMLDERVGEDQRAQLRLAVEQALVAQVVGHLGAKAADAVLFDRQQRGVLLG